MLLPFLGQYFVVTADAVVPTRWRRSWDVIAYLAQSRALLVRACWQQVEA